MDLGHQSSVMRIIMLGEEDPWSATKVGNPKRKSFVEHKFVEFYKLVLGGPDCGFFFHKLNFHILRSGQKMGQSAETQFAEFGKLSLPCPVCRKKIRQTDPRIRQIGFRQTGHIPLDNLHIRS